MFLFLITTFIVGSAVGSYLNNVISRSVKGESNIGRSYCDHCHKTLSTIDLVPILSFIALGAKCRYCKKPLSWQYPFVELLTAFLFTSAFYLLVSTGPISIITVLFYFFLISVSIVVAVIDIKYYLIPTTFVYLASLITLFYNFFILPTYLFYEHIIAAFAVAFFFLIIVVATRGKGMGQGDIVLVFLIGMVLGYQNTFAAMFIAFLLGALISVALILIGKKRFGQTIPFAPFLIGGFLLSLFWGTELINWYLAMLY